MKGKNALWSLLAIAGMAIAVVSCKKDDPIPVFEVASTPLTFTAAPEASQTVAVTAENLTWTATVNQTAANWLSVVEASDKITVTATANETAEPRNGTITVTPDHADFEPVVITVSQAGEGRAFSVASDPLEFTAAPEETQDIAVTAQHVGWTATVSEGAAGWLSVEEASDKIIVTAGANDLFSPRSGEITVTPDHADFEPVVIAVTQAERPKPVLDMPAAANSHIVAPGGSVYLAVDRAYEVWSEYLDTELTGEPTAELVWETTVGLVSAVELVEGLTGTESVIEVTADGTKSGNAVVGVSIDGEIRWTWHLWITDATIATYTTTSNVEFMDRNLGAMTPGVASQDAAELGKRSWGLYYQWGRPQPVMWADMPYFTAPNSPTAQTSIGVPIDLYDATGAVISYLDSEIVEDAGLAGAITNPVAYMRTWRGAAGDASWLGEGDTKTIFDPCPAGWRVPVSGTWAAADYDSSSKHLSGSWTRGANLNGAWIPGAGRYERGYLVTKDEDGFITDIPASAQIEQPGTYWWYWFANVSAAGANPYCMSLGGFGNPNYANATSTRAVAQQIRCVKDTAAAE